MRMLGVIQRFHGLLAGPLLLLGTVVPGVGQDAPAPAPAATSGTTEEKLRSGDRLLFRVAEDPVKGAEPMTVAINSVGEASFPVTRGSDLRVTVSVRDRTLAQVRELVREELLREYYHQATVELALDVKSITPGKVQFFGEIKDTLSIMPDQPPMKLSEVILQLVPPDSADLRRVKVHRVDAATKQPRVIEVDVRAIIKEGRRENDLVLEDGDRVEVRQKWIN